MTVTRVRGRVGWSGGGRAAAWQAIVIVPLLVALGFAVSVNPRAVAATFVLAALCGVVLSRPFVGVMILCSSFYFEGYLSPVQEIATPEKAIGIVVAIGCFGAWATGAWPFVWTRGMILVMSLLVWLIPTGVLAENHTDAILTIGRYLAFIVAYVAIVQATAGKVHRGLQLTQAMVYAGGVASIVGVVLFVQGSVQRASGPVSDPNDFAFLLGATLPIGLYHARRAGERYERFTAALASAAMIACLLATLSRGEFVGLAAGGCWALLSGRLSVRWLVVLVAVGGLAAGSAYYAFSGNVTASVDKKQQIAQNDVNARLYYWRVAVSEFEANPVTGVGPGQFEDRFFEYAPAYNFKVGTQTTHNTYLNILAELGIVGCAVFALYFYDVWRCLRLVANRGSRAWAEFADSLTVSFIVAAVSAAFLTEQYYAPLWVLGALASALAYSMAVGRSTSE